MKKKHYSGNLTPSVPLESVELPLSDENKHYFILGVMIIHTIINQKEDQTAFSIAVVKYLNAQNKTKVLSELILSWRDTPEDVALRMKLSEIYLFYIVCDLILRVYSSEFYDVVAEAIDPENAKSEKKDHFKDIQITTLDIIKGILFAKAGWDKFNQIKHYRLRAKHFPKPALATQALRKAEIEIPEPTSIEPQFLLNTYTDSSFFFYNGANNANLLIKDLGYLVGLAKILKDGENRPAQVLNAYFPYLSNYIRDIAPKLIPKNIRESMVVISQADFGLLYICADIFKRLGLSPYRNLVAQIEKSASGTVKTAESKPVIFSPTHLAFLPNIINKDFQDVKYHLEDIQVVKDYEVFAKNRTWFNESPH